MAVSTFKRYEIKFILNKQQYEAILPRLGEYMIPDKYCENGRNYNIYNIYYDTRDSHIIRTSIEKPFYKEKLRLRSYTAPTSMDDKVFLELKKKTGGIVYKRRASMTLREAYDFIQSGKRPVTNKYINAQVANEISYFLNTYKVSPAAYISYSRKAFFGKDNKDFRITFDCDIKTRRTDIRLEKGNFGTQLLEDGRYLMEVKITDSVPLWLSGILSELKLYRTGFSKYGLEYKNYCLNNTAKERLAAAGEKSLPHALTGGMSLQPDVCANF